MKNKKPELRLSIFAIHIGQLQRADAPNEFSLHPCEGVNVKVRIEKAISYLEAEGSVWDGVYFNDLPVGNRCGAAEAFTKLICAANPTIILD